MNVIELIEKLQEIAKVSPTSKVLAGFRKGGDYDYHEITSIDDGFVSDFPKDNAPLILLLNPEDNMSGG